MNPLHNPGVHQMPGIDIENGDKSKDLTDITTSGSDTIENAAVPPTPVLLKGRLARWNAKVEGLAGLEARGITRVLPGEKHGLTTMGYLQMFSLWFSINLVVENIVIALLGPLVFNLGWKDCVYIVIFANVLSSCGAAYTGTFSAESGNRTMVCLYETSDPEVSICDAVGCGALRTLQANLSRGPHIIDPWSIFHGILAV